MEYAIALIFFNIALVGAIIHYMKDRYLEKTIDCSLFEYCNRDRKSTFNALKAIVAAAIPLSLTHTTGWHFSLSEVYGLIGVGYGCDSFFNKA